MSGASFEEKNEFIKLIKHHSFSDDEICCYLKKNSSITSDTVLGDLNLTSLHWAVWFGRQKLCEWLVYVQNADVNAVGKWANSKQKCTPLAIALEYGYLNIAVFLIQAGAQIQNIECCILNRPFLIEYTEEHSHYDSFNNMGPQLLHGSQFELKPIFNNCSSLDICYMPNNVNRSDKLTNRIQALCFGSNDNFVIGPKMYSKPSKLSAYHDNFAFEVKKILLGEFHSVILTKCGKVFSCGINRMGRLGHSDGKSVTEFRLIEFEEEIQKICIGRDHSMFLTSDNKLYVCGDNSHGVLGLGPETSFTNFPKLVPKVTSVKSIACSDIHCVGYNRHKLYCWGSNIGQMGLIKEEQIHYAHAMPFQLIVNDEIDIVSCSNNATVVATSMGYVYIFKNHNIQRLNKISVFESLSFINLEISGGFSTKGDRNKANDALSIALLTSAGTLYYWSQEMHEEKLILLAETYIKSIAFNKKNLYCITDDGRIYSANVKIEGKNFVVHVDDFMEFYGVIDIAMDPLCNNFVILVNDPILTIKSFTPQDIYFELWEDLVKLKDDCDDSYDITLIHKNSIFYAHRYILAKNSQELAHIFKKQINATEIKLPDNFPLSKTMHQAYGGQFIDRFNNLKEEMPQLFDLDILENLMLANIYEYIFLIESTENPQLPVDWLKKKQFCGDYLEMPEFASVKLVSSDKVTFSAHSCILSARSAYFRALLSRWSIAKDKSKCQILNIEYPATIVKIMLTYMYQEKLECSPSNLFTVMLCADEYSILSLFKRCLLEIANVLTIKNIECLLEQPDWIMQSPQFEAYCYLYVCQNLKQFLKRQSFNSVDSKFIERLSDHYCNLAQIEKVHYIIEEPFDYELYNYLKSANAEELFSEIQEGKMKRLRNETIEKKKKSRTRVKRRSMTNLKKDEHSVTIKENIDVNIKENVIEIKQRSVSMSEELLQASPVNSFSLDGRFPELFSPEKNLSFNLNKMCVRTPIKFSKMTRLSQRERKLSEQSQDTPIKTIKESPWKICEPPKVIKETPIQHNLNDIIAKEKQHKQSANRHLNKPMKYIVLEDKAIEALSKFYNINNVEEEIITVVRKPVELNIHPVWVPPKK